MLIGLDEFLLFDVTSFGTNKQQHETVTTIHCSPSFDEFSEISKETFDWVNEIMKCANCRSDTVGEMCNKVPLLLAVTLFNQIKLERRIKFSEL